MGAISSFCTEWAFGKIGCNIYGLFTGGLGFTIIGTMAFISLEKYMIVRKPFLRFKFQKPWILRNQFLILKVSLH